MVLKRLMAPGYWPIEKKTKKYVVQPRPGPHSAGQCMPLGVVIRDMLGCARNMKEVESILNAGHVKVDKTLRKSAGFPVGFMDVLCVGNESYRMTTGRKGLSLENISPADASVKLLRIENKSHVRGKVQLGFHDGRNMLSDKDCKTGDTAVFDLEKKAVREILRLEKNSLALITGGNNAGEMGKITDIIVTKSSTQNQIVVDMGDRKIMLPKHYIFVVGKNEPVIKIQSSSGDAR